MNLIIGDLANPVFEIRKKFVVEILIEKMKLPLEWRDLNEDFLKDPLSALRGPSVWEALWVSPDFSKEILAQWPKVPSEVLEVGMADSLVKSQKQWWFRCFLREAFREQIIQSAPHLDTHAIVYVTGSDVTANLCASVAIQMGFRRVIIVARDQQQSEEMIKGIQRRFFDLDIHWIRDTELTLQPNNGSLLLNTIKSDSGEAILDDLPYLNFLQKTGLVVDLSLPVELKQLKAEAEHIGVCHISGFELLGFRDFLFLQSVLGERLTLSREDYLREWKTRR